MSPRLSIFLSAALLALACHPQEPPAPPADPPALAEIVEWLVGEQLRGSKTSNRGTNLGIVTISLSAASYDAHTFERDSCAPNLVSFIPVPATAHEWLAADAAGLLLRYSSNGWAAVQTKVALPPIAKLLGFSGTSYASYELLVQKKDDDEQLWQLTFFEGVVIGVQGIGRENFTKRAGALQRIDSRRCLSDRDCLHLVAIDKEVILEREPVLYDNWMEIFNLRDARARDVRYLDSQGKTISLLVEKPCDPPEPEPPALATTEPATPEPTPATTTAEKPTKPKPTKPKPTKPKPTKPKPAQPESAPEKTP